MKTRLPFLLLSLVLVAALAACGGGGSSGPVPADAIAQVGSAPITKATFNGLVAYACAIDKAKGQPCPKIGTPTYTAFRDSLVTFLVQQEEIRQKADALGLSVTQKDIAKQVEQIRKTYYQGSEKKFDDALKTNKVTLAQLEQFNVGPNLLDEKVRNKVAPATVSSAAALKYYNTNKASFSTPATREVRHILVKTKALGAKLEKEVKNGANFAKLAKKYSKDTSSAAQGGKLCVVHGSQTPSGSCIPTVAPFDKAAFSLKTDEVSLVHSKFGWHVIQPIGAVKPAHTQTFAEVKSEIQTNLGTQQQSAGWTKWLATMADDFKGKVSYATGYTPATTTSATTTG